MSEINSGSLKQSWCNFGYSHKGLYCSQLGTTTSKQYYSCTCQFFDVVIVKLIFSFQANSESSLGKYVAGSVEGKAGDTGLFVKNHAY